MMNDGQTLCAIKQTFKSSPSLPLSNLHEASYTFFSACWYNESFSAVDEVSLNNKGDLARPLGDVIRFGLNDGCDMLYSDNYNCYVSNSAGYVRVHIGKHSTGLKRLNLNPFLFSYRTSN